MYSEGLAAYNLKRMLHLRRALRFVWESAPAWTAAGSVLIVVQGVVPLVALYATKLVVDSVTAALSAADPAAAFHKTFFYIAFAGGAILLGALCGSLAELVREQQIQAVSDHMNGIIQRKSVEVDLAYYENPEYFDKLYRAQREGPYRPYSIVSGIMQTSQNTLSLVIMSGLLFSFHWSVGAVLFAAGVPGILIQLKYANRIFRWYRRQTPLDRRTSYFNWMLTSDLFAKEIRLFGLGSLFMDRYRNARRQLRKEKLRIIAHRSFAGLAAQTGAVLVIVAAYAFVAYRTIRAEITLGDMVMYFGAFQRGLTSLQQALGGMASLYEDTLFVGNLYEFLEVKTGVREPAEPRPLPKPIRSGIVFDHVSFQYSTDSRKVLDGIDLRIEAGEAIALVGANGSGKTTLTKLLCRLYDPTEGAIRLDGTDLRDFDTASLRREIGIVFQDYVHYNLSGRDNIWFGDLSLPSDHERIIAAARKSGAHEVLQRFDRGYDTTLGKWFEDGEELSAGEWQKLALARAFVRDAQIVILDEPTSAVDAKTEYEIFSSFRELTRGRTSILISHRFSTVRMADRIFVIAGGRLVESGTHKELIRSGGQYARWFETQAQYYR